MNETVAKIKRLLTLKVKFAMTSLVATGVDITVYSILVYAFEMEMLPSTIIAYLCGMVINFFMQKHFVFDLQRKISTTFLLSLLISLGGLVLDALIVVFLGRFAFFQRFKFFPKLIAKGVVFFYNFYLKRYAFEKRFVD